MPCLSSAAVVITEDQDLQISAEEELARQLTALGVQGVPSYRLVPREVIRDKAKVKEWFGKEPRTATRFGDVLALKDVDAVVIVSVVPTVLVAVEAMCRVCFRSEPLVVGPETRTGMPVRYDQPREVGADRIVNAVAAFARKRCSLIVVDFGTATTFDYVSHPFAALNTAWTTGFFSFCAKSVWHPRQILV